MTLAVGIRHDDFLFNLGVRVHVVAVYLRFIVAGDVHLDAVKGGALSTCCFADLPGPVHVWQAALWVPANCVVSIVRTLKYMAFSALRSFLAVSNSAKGTAYGGRRVDSNVGITTVVVGAVAAEEVQTRWNAMRSWLV